MFTPIHLLPQHSIRDRNKYQDRWTDPENQRIRDKILRIIRNGAGEDFLQTIYEGNQDFFEDMWDLKGINISGEEINFPSADNFTAIDFSYASFYHSKLTNATFYNTAFYFTKIYNCEFINCIFAFAGFYGSTLEKTKFINCEFIEYHRITNCDFTEVKFENCFILQRPFFDCKFDEQTIINDPLDKPLRMPGNNLKLSKSDLAEIFKGIKESYMAGDVIKQARQYFFKERQSVTRYNSKNLREKINGYFLELITGYGIKPFRVLLAMLIVFLIFSIIFISKIGFSEGLLLSAGAFFTFGANTNYLQTLGTLFKIVYIAEPFFGISLMALFITVLANYWFREK
jgi:uncharacterized protein YjbI with pentapeptide repeats